MAHQNCYTLLAAQEIINLINIFSYKVLTFLCCTVARMFTSDSILSFRVRIRTSVMTLCVNPCFPGFEWPTQCTHSSCVHILKELLNACHSESKLFTLPTASAPRLVLTGTSIMYANEMLLLLCTIYPVASSKVFVYKEVNLQPMGWVHPRTARNVAQHFCK